MTKPLLKITAKTKQDKNVDLEFKSIKQAQFFNQNLTDFEVKGLVDKKQKKISRWEK